MFSVSVELYCESESSLILMRVLIFRLFLSRLNESACVCGIVLLTCALNFSGGVAESFKS